MTPGDRVWRLASDRADGSSGTWLAVDAETTPPNRFSVVIEGHYNGAPLLDDGGMLVGFLTVYSEEGVGLTPNEAIYQTSGLGGFKQPGNSQSLHSRLPIARNDIIVI